MKVRRYLRVFICVVLLGCLSIGGLFFIYPKPYLEEVEKYSTLYGVDPLLVYSVMKAESGYDPNAISRSGAKGLMQIMNQTGSWGAKECNISSYSNEKLFEPSINIQIGSWYLAKLINQYEGNLDLVLTAYNAGTGNVAKWRTSTQYSEDGRTLHTIPFKETRSYVKKVSFHYALYRLLYNY